MCGYRSAGISAVALTSAQDTALLDVRDTGTGIPADLLPRVFDLFVRGATGEVGSGIGLHLVRRLVEMHGGTVTARSAGVAQGAEFSVRLPLA
jgi:signal transduction histidine kinase